MNDPSGAGTGAPAGVATMPGTETTAGAPPPAAPVSVIPPPPAAPLAPAAAQLPRLVRFAVDSDDLASLFPASFVRTYSDLIPGTAELQALQARFPDSVIELIDRGLGDPTGTANIYDVEPGALTAAQAADRIKAGDASGRQWQTVYCDEEDLADVIGACQGLNYWHWIAAWGTMVVASHRDAQVQFASAQMLGLHADLTVVWNPGYRPAPGAGAAAAAAQAAHASYAMAAAVNGQALGHAKTVHGALAIAQHDMAVLSEFLTAHAAQLAAAAPGLGELARLIP